MNNFRIIKTAEIKDNPFKLIARDWMLITAGNKESFNCMTASWGMMGHIWNKDVALVVIRPTRFTYQFTEKNEYFTICIFDKQYRDVLNVCGTKSGRDFDKIKATGLIPLETKLGSIYYKQARLVMECRKLYVDDLKEGNFLDSSIIKMYPEKDYHRMYVGEIIQAFEKI